MSTTTTAQSRMATQKQYDFIKKLVDERDLTGEEGTPSATARTAVELGRILWRENGDLTAAAASSIIKHLLDAPKKAEAAAAPADAPEGMHQVDGDIYKVQVAVHGSGRPYAKKLVLTQQGDETEVSFDYAPGALRLLSGETLMPLEEAKKFGQLYGVCCVCGRTLTDETSIKEGIGPICGSRFDR